MLGLSCKPSPERRNLYIGSVEAVSSFKLFCMMKEEVTYVASRRLSWLQFLGGLALTTIRTPIQSATVFAFGQMLH
jgi:hypothetical protein